jgi:hypothetical protein
LGWRGYFRCRTATAGTGRTTEIDELGWRDYFRCTYGVFGGAIWRKVERSAMTPTRQRLAL